MKEALLLCALAAMFFAAAPLTAGITKANTWLMGFLVAAGTLVVYIPLLPRLAFSSLTMRNGLICVAAGVLNGLGFLAYYKLIAGGSQGLWETSRVLPITFILIPVFIVFGSRAVFSEPLTPQKLLGLVFAGAAIWFLK